MIHVITAVVHDPKHPSASVITLESLSDELDIMQAVRAACNEWCRSEEGRRDYEYANGYFNWGDFANCVPDEVCQRHGFKHLSTVDTVMVDHDEVLRDEIEEEDEN